MLRRIGMYWYVLVCIGMYCVEREPSTRSYLLYVGITDRLPNYSGRLYSFNWALFSPFSVPVVLLDGCVHSSVLTE